MNKKNMNCLIAMILIFASILSFPNVLAIGTISDIVFTQEIPDFVAGSEVNFSFSFDFETINEEFSPIIIFVNVSSNDSNFPVWKGDFDLKGTMKVNNGFFPDDYFNFKCYEYIEDLEDALDINDVEEIHPGEFYCSDYDLLALNINSENEVEMEIESNPALWPGKYNFSISLYYIDSIVLPTGLVVYSPEDGIYSERKLEFNLTTDRKMEKMEYIDWSDRKPRWRRLCRDCDEYGNERRKIKSFSDGEHNITIRATTYSMNTEEKNISFFIDTRNPRISKTEPRRRDYSRGDFIVEFMEENPENLTLYFGNDSYRVNLSECYEYRRRTKCEFDVDVFKYDGMAIDYWFVLEDIAGNKGDSRKIEINVDLTPPVLNDFDFEINRRSVEFFFNITELNFDEVVYNYLDDRGIERERLLCSRLKDGICERRKYFREGDYNITINILDEANNKISFPMNFSIEY